MKILEINSVDFSSYVSQKSWKVQNAKEYDAWVDGNRITHRTLTRQKVTGQFTLSFSNPTDYEAFKTAVAAATTADDYTTITIYVDNEHQLMTINAFLTTTTKTVWTQQAATGIDAQTPYLFNVAVKLEQR